MSCERLTDRMAGVLAGRDRWTREDEEHLALCDECRAEWQLLGRAAVIGRNIPVDTARISRQVASIAIRKRESRAIRRGFSIGFIAAVAASLFIVLRSNEPVSDERPPIATAGLEIPLLELDSLSAGQLQAVLETMEAPLGAESTVEPTSLQDLNDYQLEQLLRSLEG